MASLLIILHALAAVIWVGGLIFAFTVLRPSVDEQEVPVKMTLLAAIFRRFFVWVWAAVVVLPASGYALGFLTFGGFAGAGLAVHLMQGLGWVMIALFVILFTVPYPPFRKAVAAADWPTAAVHLPRIRRIILINIVLGALTVAVGASARFWG